MIRISNQMIVTPTDLVGFLACEHRTRLEWEAAAGLRERAFDGDPVLDLVSRKGAEHEVLYLGALLARGLRVADLGNLANKTLEESRAAENATLGAMRQGVDVVYQGVFFDGRWRGRPDFLRRVEKPSALGAWSYEAIDTKLARDVKAGAIVQLVLYSTRLGELQGAFPESMHVITGAGEPRAFRLADYASYVRTIRDRFEARLSEADPLEDTYPHPVEHCRVCNWASVCGERRRRDDHTSLVAGMTRTITRKLAEADLATMAALGTTPADAVSNVAQPTFTRLRAQAALQLQQRADGAVRYELIEDTQPETPATVMTAEKTRGPVGLRALPLPTPDDLFFDIEADPWAGDDGEGIEYLFGIARRSPAGALIYEALWAHSAEQEKALLESFIDRAQTSLAANPGFHIYHYGAYEVSALKRLVGRYGTRDLDLDSLLRAEVFVDLYAVVRQGVRVSQDSYSLKKVEALYMPHREGPITKAGFSVVEYERWLEDRDEARLKALAEYNRDDCISTLKLRDWLEERRAELEKRSGVSVPRPEPKSGAEKEAAALETAANQARIDRLRAGLSLNADERDADGNARWRLSLLLDFYRRERRPEWWKWFYLAGLSSADLVEETDAIGDLSYHGEVTRVNRSIIHRYTFDPDQPQKFRKGKKAVDPETRKPAGIIHGVDAGRGFIDLVRAKTSPVPHPKALIPAEPVFTTVLEKALGRFAEDVMARGFDVGSGPWQAARQLLLRSAPRIDGHAPGTPVRLGAEPSADAAVRSILGLKSSYLAIQGPPGAGKTWTAAQAILALYDAGKRVALTAQSHKVIGNLIEAVLREAAHRGKTVRIAQISDEFKGVEHPDVIVTDANGVVDAITSGRARISAGTAWPYSSDTLAGLHDVIFIDEAGQFSLANACAVSGTAESMVLIGDPNQLAQVTKGSHPEGAGLSALEHVLGGEHTLSPEQGLFLDETYRLHPDLSALISGSFYEGRLRSHPRTRSVRINGGGSLSGTGLRLKPIDHKGRASKSPEEVELVVELIRDLLGRTWVDNEGRERLLTPEDILVVAPFNAQVAAIAEGARNALGVEPRVGTVDRFQGQEGAVVIYSMTSSSAEDAPRDLEFLYSPNRLNVSLSRAQALAVLVYNKALLQASCRTPEQMKLANALCRLVESASTANEHPL